MSEEIDTKKKDIQKMAWEAIFYSDKRIDVLLISISSAGIYVCLETLKFFKQEKLDSPHIIKFAGIIFVFGIILNIISQFTGKYSNHYYFLSLENDIEVNEGSKKEKCYKTLSDCFNLMTTIFNILSALFLVIGLIDLIYFFMTYL